MDKGDERSPEFEAAELCLQWHHHHNTLVSVFDTLWERQELVDVTLSAQGQSIQVHRMILCACSQYFQELLTQRQFTDKQAIVFLKDVNFEDLEALVHYMYKGEVRISEDQLSSFLSTAKALKIRGITSSSSQEESRKRKHVEAECGQIRDAPTAVLPQPPPLKHMASLTKMTGVQPSFPAESYCERKSSPASTDDRNSKETVWQESVEEAENVETALNQNDVGESGSWLHDSGDGSAEMEASLEETASAHQDGSGVPSLDDSTVLYSLLMQSSAGEQESCADAAAGIQDGSNDSVEEEELMDHAQDDQLESSDQEAPSNDYLDQVASQAIVPNRRSSKKDSAGKRPLYSCNRCGRIYSKKHSVLRHLRYECGVEPQFQCSICNQRFKHRSDQQRHERKIHGVEPAPYDEEGGGGEISDNV